MRKYIIFAILFIFIGSSLSPVISSNGSISSNLEIKKTFNKPDCYFEEHVIQPGPVEDENAVSTINLLPGDIILLGTDDSFFDYIIPGKFSHTEMYCGKVKIGEKIWDRDNHVWMTPGTPYVIHSNKGATCGDGLGYSRWDIAVNHHADNVIVIRVLKEDGTRLTTSEREAVVGFAKNKLTGGPDGYPVGPPFDWNWFGKQIDIDSIPPAPKGYYCSEIVWASYIAALGIDLDSDTSPFGIAVSPDDIWHSQYTYVVACEIGDMWFNAPQNMAKLTVFVDDVYYYDDYDPWPLGAGEMYLISRSGLGLIDEDDHILATEEGFPGCGKIGDTPDGYWSLDGEGSLDWNCYFESIVPVGKDIRVQIEAWEVDDISADDQYPIFLTYLNHNTWEKFIDGGWHKSKVDLDDCKYNIWYRIDSLP